MNVVYDTSYGGFNVRWDDVKADSYRVVIQKILPDGKTEDLLETSENYAFAQGWDLVGYCAQENDYYGRLRFHVEALDQNGNVMQEGDGPIFLVTDFFPEEKEKEIGDRTIRSFSYHIGTHSSMTMEKEPDSLQNCFIYNNGKEITFEASYTVGRNERNAKKKLKEKDWEELLTYIRKGKLVRKQIDDPNMVVLDGGSPEMLDITMKDFDRIEERFYELGLSGNDKEELLIWIRKKCV